MMKTALLCALAQLSNHENPTVSDTSKRTHRLPQNHGADWSFVVSSIGVRNKSSVGIQTDSYSLVALVLSGTFL